MVTDTQNPFSVALVNLLRQHVPFLNHCARTIYVRSIKAIQAPNADARQLITKLYLSVSYLPPSTEHFANITTGHDTSYDLMSLVDKHNTEFKQFIKELF